MAGIWLTGAVNNYRYGKSIRFAIRTKKDIPFYISVRQIQFIITAFGIFLRHTVLASKIFRKNLPPRGLSFRHICKLLNHKV